MESFDTIAPVYDSQFSHATSGRLQRQEVWDYLAADVYFQSPRYILDSPCGTGEDALWLAACGHTVTAVDVSVAMLSEAKKKDRSGLAVPPQFLKLDMIEPHWNWPDASFDVVLSNFSGLNCFDEKEMESIAANIIRLLKPRGRAILVLFGKHCITELIYFMAKGQFRTAGRRWSRHPASANVEGEPVRTWYHSPRQVQQWFAGLRLRNKMAVGLFYPPSYLEEKFNRHEGWQRLSGKLERLPGRKGIFSTLGDHILLDFEKP